MAALTIEYKAPHKLTLGHIYEGLGEMDLDEVVEVGEDERTPPRDANWRTRALRQLKTGEGVEQRAQRS
jgi:hypothetical protein